MSAPLIESSQGMGGGRARFRLPTQLRIAGQEVPLPPVSSLAVPMLAVVVLAMMLLPLPAPVLDFLFTFNIASSLLVLLVAVYTVKALDFAVFPTVLLVTTLMRLSLSVASTRAVLMYGHTGTDAAGKVIEAVLLRCLPALRWMPCPASRWPSMPISTPARSTRPRPVAAGRK